MMMATTMIKQTNMPNDDIYRLFKKLKPYDGKSYEVENLPGTEHKLGISVEGYPKFFLRTNDSGIQCSNTNLEILTVEYNLLCSFEDENSKEAQYNYTVLTLRSSDVILQENFIAIIELVVRRLPSIPARHDIAIEVENLKSIFSAAKRAPRKITQGLWAELLVISRSGDPEKLVEAWHSQPAAKFDFALGCSKLEVKSTSGDTRIHHFSLDQLCPSANSTILIASMVVRECARGNGGLSVEDLRDEIFKRLQSIDARLRLVEIIADTLGEKYGQARKLTFDYVGACDALRFYNAVDIPSINKEDIHAGVTNVGFDSNLTDVKDIASSGDASAYADNPLYNMFFSKSSK